MCSSDLTCCAIPYITHVNTAITITINNVVRPIKRPLFTRLYISICSRFAGRATGRRGWCDAELETSTVTETFKYSYYKMRILLSVSGFIDSRGNISAPNRGFLCPMVPNFTCLGQQGTPKPTQKVVNIALSAVELLHYAAPFVLLIRSEERRVGKECRL